MRLLPLVQDEEWFFDTELLVLAQRRGLRIHEIPVDWVEDADSRVEIVPTALADLRGVARLLVHRPPGGQRLGADRAPPTHARAVSSVSYPARRWARARGRSVRRPRVASLLAYPELLGLLALTAVLNLWDLGINGWANTYYSAAIRSMSTSWHDFLFASLDKTGLMTVDSCRWRSGFRRYLCACSGCTR